MLYEYQCKKCDKVHEKVFKMTDFPNTIKCESCGGKASKIISKAVTFTDNDIPWMPSASKVLTKHHERPITTRTEYKKYLKDNSLAPKC